MKTDTPADAKSYILHVKGLVQGVGFRPFIYRLATEMGINGCVENRNNGVFIKINATDSLVKIFEKRIHDQSPPASVIQSVSVKECPPEKFSDFRIVKSNNVSHEITQVSPDIAICNDCLRDMQYQEHRLGYSFVNCTNCGPRFSIIRELPYDRQLTTMQSFSMCSKCLAEYTDISNRRFHAQPVACNNCGPKYQLQIGKTFISEIDEILSELTAGILKGKVYAVKGTGGFHLMCDATNEIAVSRLRVIKNRDAKPFAVMASDIRSARQIAELNHQEEELLLSWQRPIVLVNYKGGLAAGVTNGLSKVGVMLPYMPFHYQLFSRMQPDFIVLTSGNLSDEPILIDNEKAYSVLSHKTDGLLTYNRDIHNRVDDSVCCVTNNKVYINRRSRGFSPQPILTRLNTEGIFAAGAELVNSFCMGKGQHVIMSQYIGDLKNIETLEFYEETYNRFKNLFRFKPEVIVMDFHPDYLSSKFAQKLSEDLKIPLVKVQHHHAHIASVMISNKLETDVIGVSFDGIGLGNDGNIWGGEFMKADLLDFERLYHFEYIPMPGGDAASKEPWRMAISYLFRVFGDDLLNLDLPVLKSIEKTKIENIIRILKKKTNTPLASSAGRLFDAVSSIIGIANYNSFQAEAPMRMESVIAKNEKGSYKIDIVKQGISFHSMIREIVKDYGLGVPSGIISAKFHNTIINLTVDICARISNNKGLKKIVLSGGTFQNSYLTENIENRLNSAGFKVFLPLDIPVNDQGIAMGQLAIAAKKRSLGLL